MRCMWSGSGYVCGLLALEQAARGAVNSRQALNLLPRACMAYELLLPRAFGTCVWSGRGNIAALLPPQMSPGPSLPSHRHLSTSPPPLPFSPFSSDEMYALPAWGKGAPRMVSMEVIAREEAASLPGGDARAAQLLHIVFGLSKDFCASGLRMGCLHTRNALLTRVRGERAGGGGAGRV